MNPSWVPTSLFRKSETIIQQEWKLRRSLDIFLIYTYCELLTLWERLRSLLSSLASLFKRQLGIPNSVKSQMFSKGLVSASVSRLKWTQNGGRSTIAHHRLIRISDSSIFSTCQMGWDNRNYLFKFWHMYCIFFLSLIQLPPHQPWSPSVNTQYSCVFCSLSLVYAFLLLGDTYESYIAPTPWCSGQTYWLQ